MGKERDGVVAGGEVAPLLCLQWRGGGLQSISGEGGGSRAWKMTPAGEELRFLRGGGFRHGASMCTRHFPAGAAVQKQLLELQRGVFVYQWSNLPLRISIIIPSACEPTLRRTEKETERAVDAILPTAEITTSNQITRPLTHVITQLSC